MCKGEEEGGQVRGKVRGLCGSEGCQAAIQEKREEVRCVAAQGAEERVESWLQGGVHGGGDGYLRQRAERGRRKSNISSPASKQPQSPREII